MEFRQLVTDLIERSKKIPAEELRAWPAIQEVTVSEVQITKFHDCIEEGRHLFAIQALNHRLQGMKTDIEVQGFVLNHDGIIETASEELLWQFM